MTGYDKTFTSVLFSINIRIPRNGKRLVLITSLTTYLHKHGMLITQTLSSTLNIVVDAYLHVCTSS